MDFSRSSRRDRNRLRRRGVIEDRKQRAGENAQRYLGLRLHPSLPCPTDEHLWSIAPAVAGGIIVSRKALQQGQSSPRASRRSASLADDGDGVDLDQILGRGHLTNLD